MARGQKITNSWRRGEGATAACSLKGLKGFVGMQVTGEAGSMAAAPVHKFRHADGRIEELSKAWGGLVAHGKGTDSSGCTELGFVGMRGAGEASSMAAAPEQ